MFWNDLLTTDPFAEDDDSAHQHGNTVSINSAQRDGLHNLHHRLELDGSVDEEWYHKGARRY